MSRRAYAVWSAFVIAAAPLLAVATPQAQAVAPAAAAAPGSVTLVGSLQSEAGCATDWDPACAATHLSKSGSMWTGTFTLPGGAYEFKVAINDSWTENYGAAGAADGANIPLVTGGPATLAFSYDESTHRTTFTPLGLASGTQASDPAYAQDSLRSALTRERFYFVMADRFANGNTANDTGGLTGGRLSTGFDPTDKAFYHGGDLAGLTSKLDYIKGMGTTAIWLTPSFKNKPVQGNPGQESAGYHGYWITDFTQIDPHLGSNADMKALIDAAHSKGMKVFFDIITNHTADVIDYREGSYAYRTKKNYPYRDASGTAFDDRSYVNATFPALDPAVSFPYTPFLHAGDEHAKTPAWLNDVTMYHNRGDSTFAGESSTYGDFVGLDDLFTERPEVVSGMGAIYKTWVDFGIDGFRIDTVKHVNLEFWQKFIPDILGEAKRIKKDDFFAFGEVYDGNPAVMSQYTTAGKLQATLDFGFQQQGVDFAKGKPAKALADFFALDDWYTDADSNAYQLPTFLGNHDMGRVAMFLQSASTSDAQLLQRVSFADSLLYLVRGNPVTYYGDEQGLIGTGGDQLAREDLFASQVAIYNGEKVLGGPSGSMDRYNTDHVLYQHLRDLAKVRAKYPALADGAQINRYAADGAGIFAISRYDRDAKVEYVVAANNATTAQSASFATWSPGAVFTPVYGAEAAVKPAKDGSVTVTVPPLTVSVWRANKPVATGTAAPTVAMTLAGGSAVYGRAEIGATVTSPTFAQTTFLVRLLGAHDWTVVGTDDNAPFRVFHDVSGMPLGSVLEYRAITRDAAGRVAGAGSWAVTGTAPAAPVTVEIGDPVTQPTAVSVPGTHNSEMGCPITLGASGDWAPDCDQAQLALDPKDAIWKRSYTLPVGSYGYKVAIDKSWTENYGAKGEPNGANISYETTTGNVTFYYDHATHWGTSDAEGAIVTAPGSYQKALGCPADWDPSCMRPWLEDKDGDGTYTFATKLLPPGSYTFKVAEGLSWTVNYGAGGVPNGGNLTVTVPAAGATTTFSYDSATHQTSVTSQ